MLNLRQNGSAAKLRILCVDDEDQILILFRELLKNTGDEIYTASNGIDALAKVKELRPDIVFLDIAMPHMQGDEALPLIHEVDPDIAVIIVSGYASKNEARELLARGAYDFLTKPVDLKYLCDVIEQRRFEREAL